MDRKEAIEDGVYGLMADDTQKVWNEIENLDEVKYIVVKKGYTCIKMLRNEIEGEYNFDDAQKKAAECGADWRCPTRHEWLDIYDMRFNGLDEFRERLGMEPLNGWYWSCEEDADPQYSAQYAWDFGNSGYVDGYSKRNGNRVCAVSALQF